MKRPWSQCIDDIKDIYLLLKGELDAWEDEFIRSVWKRLNNLSVKQSLHLNRIRDKYLRKHNG